MRTIIAAAALAASTAFAQAEAVKYDLDPSHSQVVFSYDHLGFSTTYGMFSGFEGTVMYDEENPENSSLEITIPIETMVTGWDARDQHFSSPDFFNVGEFPAATFTSTSIEVTGENTAKITGDLSAVGATNPVTLDVTFNKADTHPMQNKPWLGASATATIKRSDFNVGAFAPNVSDEVNLIIEIEAGQAEGA